MLHTSEEMKTAIKQFEGLSLKTYRLNGEKFYTVGFGHYGLSEPTTITKSQADSYFNSDIDRIENQLYSTLLAYGNYNEILTNQYLWDSLVSFTFNCGIGNLKKLTGDGKRSLKEIHDKIILYTKSNGTTLKGLERRRKYEQTYFGMGLIGLDTGETTNQENQDFTFYFDYYVKTNYCLRHNHDYGANTIRVTKKNEKCNILGMYDKEWVNIEIIETKENCYVHKSGLYIEIMKG